jgi:hypothetical protein
MAEHFTLLNYNPYMPALYIHRNGDMEWRVSPQSAKMSYADRQFAIICAPGDFARFAVHQPGTLHSLMKDYDADTPEELWAACKRNVSFVAPGSPFDGLTPMSEAPPAERSTVKTRRRGVHIIPDTLRVFEGPDQAMAIARWLADQFPLHSDGVPRRVSDDDIEASLYLMQKVKPVKTRQGVVHVYKYYRPRYIKTGGITEI